MSRQSRRFAAPAAAIATVAVIAVALLTLPASLAAQQPLNPPEKDNFPLTFANEGTVVGSQPVLADLGLTPGFKSIIFGTRQGKLYVIERTGPGTWGVAPGWPQVLPAHIYSSPAVADINNDGIPEIVVGFGSTFDPGKNGGLRAYNRSGTMLWEVTTGEVIQPGVHDAVQSTPAIGDLFGNGHKEVVFGSFDHQIYVVDGATGNPEPGWPVDARDTIFSSPVLYDLNGDGKLEVIIGTDAHAEGAPFNTPNGGCLRVYKPDGTVLPGFPKCIDQTIASPPVVADIDGDGKPEIIHGTGDFWGQNGEPGNPAHAVYAWHCDGTAVAGWPVAVDGQVSTSPALADINGDGKPEIIVTDDNTGPSGTYHVYAFKGDGTLLWKSQPKDFLGNTLSAGHPLVADVMGGTSALKILVPTDAEIAVFDVNGNQLTQGGAPYTNQKPSFVTETSLSDAAVGDLETDGAGNQIEVVAVSGTPFPNATNLIVHVWNPINRTSTPPWGLFRHDQARLGVFPGAGSCGSCMVSPAATKFFTVSPCRVVDTRNANGPLGGPALSAGQTRNFVLTGTCGIPASAIAVSANVTVVGPTIGGEIHTAPGGCAPGTASTISFQPGQTLANNAVLTLAHDASGNVATLPVMSSGTVHLVIDVNGYFQ